MQQVLGLADLAFEKKAWIDEMDKFGKFGAWKSQWPPFPCSYNVSSLQLICEICGYFLCLLYTDLFAFVVILQPQKCALPKTLQICCICLRSHIY